MTYLADKDISYQSDLEKSLEKLKEEMEKGEMTEDLMQVCHQIQKSIDDKKVNELQLYKEEISRLLKTEIVGRYYFNKGIIIANLYQDSAIKKAMEILSDEASFNAILAK